MSLSGHQMSVDDNNDSTLLLKGCKKSQNHNSFCDHIKTPTYKKLLTVTRNLNKFQKRLTFVYYCSHYFNIAYYWYILYPIRVYTSYLYINL